MKNIPVVVLLTLLFTSLYAHKRSSVTLQLKWKHQFQFAGYYMAKEKGFYKDFGLDVSIREGYPSIEPTKILEDGKAEYAVTSSESLQQIAGGAKLLYLAAIYQASPFALMTLQSSDIAQLEDIKGKRLMSSESEYLDISLLAMLHSHHINLNDIELVSNSFNLEDLIEKKVDLMSVYISNEPYELEQKGYKPRLFIPYTYGYTLYSDLLTTTQKEVKNHPKRTALFKEASLRGWEYAFSHIDEAVDIIYNKYNSQHKSKEALLYEAKALKKLAYKGVKKIGDIETSKLQTIIDYYKLFGYLKMDDSFEFNRLIFHEKSNVLHFTSKEEAWIAQHKTLRYSEVNWKPLSIIQNSKMQGIMGDYLDILAQKTGIEFIYVPSKNWKGVLEKFEKKEIDFVPGIGSSKKEMSKGIVSDVYATYPMVIVTGKKYRFVDDLHMFEGKTLALPKSYTSYNLVKEHYSKIHIIETKNIAEALLMVARGKADAFVGHLATALYEIKHLQLDDLKISGEAGFSFEHRYLINSEDKIFKDIVNKVLKNVDIATKMKIDNRWIPKVEQEKIDYTFYYETVVVFTLIVVLLYLRHRHLETLNQKLTKQAQVLEQIQDSVIVTNFGGFIEEWNHGATKIFGYKKEEVMGKHISLLFPKGGDPKGVEILIAAEKGKTTTVEVPRLRKDGCEIHISLTISPLRDKDGKVTHTIGYGQDITETKKALQTIQKQQEELYHQANYDYLTNLPNRLLFEDRLKHALKTAQRKKSKVALLFLDLDNFKEINDSLGHKVGDEVLKVVAKQIQSVIRKGDTLSRLGGDEFIVIAEDLKNAQDCAFLAEKILESFAKPTVINNKLSLYISFSIGVSVYPDDGSSSSDLLKNADAAMYKAKREGKNIVEFYQSELTQKAIERVLLETNMRNGLKKEEFLVYFQPQIDARNDKQVGMEALVRWKHPDMGMISPVHFIPLAESSGFIVELDRYVMRKAMTFLKEWHDKGLDPGVLSLNLSIRHLQSEDFFTFFTEAVKASACKYEWLGLEVTESQLMQNPQKSITILQKLSDLGITISIDDFGTGYSSLSYLKRLPIDKLKIDRSFILEVPQNKEDTAIVEAVIALAKTLNLELVAEGVEHEDQKDFLLEHNCHVIQGFYYLQAIESSAMTERLQS